MKKADLIIKNGLIVTVNCDMDIIENGAIAISGSKIIAINKTDLILQLYSSEKILDASNKLVIPGLINAHTHLPMTYFRGLADDLPLMEWLQEHIWPTEAKFLDPEFVYHASLHGAAEMIRGGTTFFNDMYFFGFDIARAASEAGLRGIVGEGVLDFPFAGTGVDETLEYVKASYNKLQNNELIDFTVAPHAIYTCGKENLMKSFNFAKENDMLLHIHVSETEQEVKDSLKNFGKRPVEYLNDIGFLDHKTIFAHGVWINKKEMNILKEKNIGVVVCTESNLKLASGITPVKDYLQHNITICLGTDGVSSNNDLDMFSEMDFTAKLHKVFNQDPTLLPAEKVFKMVTIDAAKALFKDDLIGSLETGKLADIVLIGIDDLESLPMYNVYSHLIYTAKNSSVKDVIINGKLVMEERKLLNLNEEELIDRAKEYYRKIKT